MNLVRWNKANALDPGREFDRLQNEINKLFDFTYPDAGGLFDRHFNPAVDITETNDAFKVMLDLPGVNRKDVDVSIAGNVLTVKGEKKEEKSVKVRSSTAARAGTAASRGPSPFPTVSIPIRLAPPWPMGY